MDEPTKPTTDDDQSRAKEQADAKSAADLIRQKLDSLYQEEPPTKEEVQEVAETTHRSKHQQFMYELSHSGQSLADIHTAWHNYYAGLPEKEKHEVWQEFYEQNDRHVSQQQSSIPKVIDKPVASSASVVAFETHQDEPVKPPVPKPRKQPATTRHKQPRRPMTENKARTVADLKGQLLHKPTRHKLKAKQHLQSLLFGLGMGSLVVLILLFSFFNERFIAPFITPSRHVSSTPIIADPNAVAPSANPEVIIPKINVEIPVIYDVPTIEEAAVEKGLERGVVHYATTPNPGEQGNVVIFGHSSNNIFNPGQYKFAFVLLSRLDNGDTFYLTKDGKLFVYRVYKKEIVQPTQVSVLGAADKPDTATLITCDPPGTSLHRLVVVGEQISPSPGANGTSTAAKSTETPKTIPSNSPSLWQRLTSWVTT